MKKKAIVCMLALTLAFSLTACGKDDKDAEKGAFKAEQREQKEDDDIEDEELEDEDIEDEDFDDEDFDDEEQVVAERGTFDGNVYTNESMGIQVTFPEDCMMLTDDQIEEFLGSGKEIMEEAYDSEAIDNSLSGTIYDVVAVNAEQTAQYQIIIEDTEATAGISLTADQYVKAMAESVDKATSSAGMEMGEPEYSETNLGGLDFAVVSFTVDGVEKEAYACEVGDYMLLFSLAYSDRAPIEEFLNSVTAL